jgi:predicted porin
MKKTIIAAAIATVIAAPAMADVSVSGVVEQSFEKVDVDTMDDWNGYTDSGLTFKASEDLGNGLTAFAQISLDTDNQDSATRTGNSEKDSKVGIKGGFGTVVVGRMEDFTEGVMAATMTLNGTGAIELGGNADVTTAQLLMFLQP